MNFNYFSPTKIYFGKDSINNLSDAIKSFDPKKVLFHYGSGSIKKNGLYNEIKNILFNNKISFIELGGVKANPDISLVRRAVKICKEEKVDFILAVGGGSVIDSAKSIACGVMVDYDPLLHTTHEREVKDCLPIGVVLTISAAGSELSNSCVISDETTNLKNGFNTDLIRPKFVIEDPTYTYSVSEFQTSCGICDIMMHTLERYLTDVTPSKLADAFALSLLKEVYKAGKVVKQNPLDYEGRSTLMLASSFSHNGLTGMGGKMYFTVHKIEHILSGMYDSIAHGAGLSVLFPAWAHYVYKHLRSRFLDIAHNVFDIDNRIPEDEAIEAFIFKLRKYFEYLGLPIYMEDFNIDIDFEKMALKATNNKTTSIPGFVELDYNDLLEIYKLASRKYNG